MGDNYDQKDAGGFIRILGLPSRSRALRDEKRLTAESAEVPGLQRATETPQPARKQEGVAS
jgi:hypothetical protein